jgi:CTP:molybdopterin cytidylyltransferase MocA
MAHMTTPHTAQAPAGMKAMIFAAGLGTRLKPFTDHHPKALAPVNGKPLLQRNIEYFAAFGIRDFIVNVHHFADQVIRFLEENGNFGYRIAISHEVDQPLETGGGLKFASWFFEKEEQPFLVMNADILTNLDLGRMLADHRVHRPLATLAITEGRLPGFPIQPGGHPLWLDQPQYRGGAHLTPWSWDPGTGSLHLCPPDRTGDAQDHAGRRKIFHR